MADPSPVVATFPGLDEAESALDWIGIDFADAGEGFEGELAADDRELLEGALGEPETPPAVLGLAAALRALLDEAERRGSGAAPWRVEYRT